ncbi:MAG: methyltransferase domain-containing protein [Desulfobacterales bacterium]|jgi:ubiquinone/menaquinone biosynthesis C-methylase UbiE
MMNDRGQRHADETVTLTNYTTRNPIIRLLLHNFMQQTGRLLKAIGAQGLYGLDAGCGEGHFLAYLYAQNILGRMVAVDLDERKLRYARQHYPLCEYRRGNIQNLPFADNTFDFVLTTEVFEHLPDPETALSELNRVARPGAHLIVSVPFEPFFHWGNLLRGLYWERGGRTPDHRSFWHRSEFRQFLSGQVSLSHQYSITTFPWLLFAGRFIDAGA